MKKYLSPGNRDSGRASNMMTKPSRQNLSLKSSHKQVLTLPNIENPIVSPPDLKSQTNSQSKI